MLRDHANVPKIPPQSVQERAKKEGWVILTNFSYVTGGVKNRLKKKPHLRMNAFCFKNTLSSIRPFS